MSCWRLHPFLAGKALGAPLPAHPQLSSSFSVRGQRDVPILGALGTGEPSAPTPRLPPLTHPLQRLCRRWSWARRCQNEFTAPRHPSCRAEKQSGFFFYYYYYNLHVTERLRNPGLSFPSRKTQTSTCQAVRQRGRTRWSHPAARAPGFPPTPPLLPPA